MIVNLSSEAILNGKTHNASNIDPLKRSGYLLAIVEFLLSEKLVVLTIIELQCLQTLVDCLFHIRRVMPRLSSERPINIR